MGIEIERKFLVKDETWNSEVEKEIHIKQGYLNSNKERTVRVRIKGKRGFLTVKGKNTNATRKEFEYEIPLSDAEEMLLLCEKPIIEKIRSEVVYENKRWEIDVFSGENQGLIIAEIELSTESEQFEIPQWLGQEVTQDTRYYNSNLINHPFLKWEQ